MSRVAVSPEIVQWARERAHLDLDACIRFDVTYQSIFTMLRTLQVQYH